MWRLAIAQEGIKSSVKSSNLIDMFQLKGCRLMLMLMLVLLLL